MNKIKTLSLFSGIGAFEKGLQNLNIDYDLINYCEIDEKASKSYSIIHDISEEKNLKDITKIDEKKLPKDLDLITYGFPCQDISLAGKQKGFQDESGNKTRSGLFFDALRIIKETQPKFAIAENVKNLMSNKFKSEFETVLNSLEDVGYNNYYKILKSSNYGLPQARERVFIVSIRKDIDKGFVFPKPIKLEKTLYECLDFRDNKDDLTKSFYNFYKEKINNLASYEDFIKYIEQIPIKENEIHTKDLKMYSFNEMNIITMLSGICGTLTCRNVINYNKKFFYNNKLYKPSPKMCFRLQGFTDEDYNKIKDIIKEKYIYKQIGNSIPVNFLYYIFKELFSQYNMN